MPSEEPTRGEPVGRMPAWQVAGAVALVAAFVVLGPVCEHQSHPGQSWADSISYDLGGWICWIATTLLYVGLQSCFKRKPPGDAG